MGKISCSFPVNRVEGDLTLQIDFENGKVAEARSVGTLYRGFEKIMRGRGAMDGLVITPRICGICSLSHLTAAAGALDNLCQVQSPDNAVRLKNIAGIMEMIQSDIRQSVLMFMPDFVNPAYSSNQLYAEAAKRYAPLRGERCVGAVKSTATIVEIMAILGGQWPHTSFMVPGGVTNVPTIHDIVQCRHLIISCKKAYENQVLGCSVERFNEISTKQELDAWLGSSQSHSESDMGFLIRFGRSIGLDAIGKSYDTFLSYGAFDIPESSCITPAHGREKLIRCGFAEGTQIHEFDQTRIAESIAHSWFNGYEGARHPFDGLTEPEASGQEGKKYSWVKAPRYDGKAVETGPLAQMVINGIPLFTDLIKTEGASALTRQMARLARPAKLFPRALQWIDEMAQMLDSAPFYTTYGGIKDGRGIGLTEAARGALGHWIIVEDSTIKKYQIITPTAWNGSPRDDAGNPGAWEKALEGVAVKDTDNPIEIGHVVRSFDPCLVCAVHRLDSGKKIFIC
jgi:hydrogenase large subunit